MYHVLFWVICESYICPSTRYIFKIYWHSSENFGFCWLIIKISILHTKLKMLAKPYKWKGNILSLYPYLKSKWFTRFSSYFFLSFNDTRINWKLRRTFLSPFIFKLNWLILRERLPRLTLNRGLIMKIWKVIYKISFSIIKSIVYN